MLKQLVFFPKSETESFRTRIEDTFSVPILPNRVDRNERSYDGVVCDLLLPEVYASHRIILYIHGGSFIGGSRASWRSFCATLANVCSSRVVLPEISLAPAHSYPAAIEDIQKVFRAMFTEEQISSSLDTENGENADPEVIIAADGSGASQALAFLFNLKQRFRNAIKHVILFSPWLNLSPSSPLIAGKKVSDEVLTGEALRCAGEIYTFASNLDNIFVSPLSADQQVLAQFPDVYIQMGGKEILLQDAKLFKEKLEQAGSRCTLDIWPDMMYMFQMADEFLPESHLALERIGKMVTARRQDPEDTRAFYRIKTESGLNADA